MLRATQLSGAVRFPDGRPAPGVQIKASGLGKGQRMLGDGSTRTDDDGAYALEVSPEKSYIVGVVDVAWAAPSHTGVVVREGRPRAGIDFTLRKGTVLHGRVTDGPGGKAASGCRIGIEEEGSPVPTDLLPQGIGNAFLGPRLRRDTTVDINGHYEFRLAPGSYALATRISAEGKATPSR
jgi:Carboxypeptidase regulatory-like domain